MSSTLSFGFLGPLSAVLSACTWAVGVSVYSKIATNRPIFVVNFTRAVTALPIFAFLVFVGGFRTGLESLGHVQAMQVMWLSLSIIASYALGDVLFLTSAQSLGVPAALAIASCYPIWSALAGWIFEGQHLALHQQAGLLLVVSGVVAVILSRRPQKTEVPSGEKDTRYARGIILALVVSLFWSLNTYATTKGGQGLTPNVANTVRMVAALFLCPLIGFFFVGKPHWPLLPANVYLKASWVFIIEGFVGSYTYIYAFTHASLAVASALTSLAPALSVPIALLTKTETLSPKRLAGIAMVVLGIAALVTP